MSNFSRLITWLKVERDVLATYRCPLLISPFQSLGSSINTDNISSIIALHGLGGDRTAVRGAGENAVGTSYNSLDDREFCHLRSVEINFTVHQSVEVTVSNHAESVLGNASQDVQIGRAGEKHHNISQFGLLWNPAHLSCRGQAESPPLT